MQPLKKAKVGVEADSQTVQSFCRAHSLRIFETSRVRFSEESHATLITLLKHAATFFAERIVEGSSPWTIYLNSLDSIAASDAEVSDAVKNQLRAQANVSPSLKEAGHLAVEALSSTSSDSKQVTQLVEVLNVVAQCLIYSSCWLTCDEWDAFRYPVQPLHFIISLRENPYLSFLCSEPLLQEGEVKPVSKGVVERATQYQARFHSVVAKTQALRNASGIMGSNSLRRSLVCDKQSLCLAPAKFPFEWGARGGCCVGELRTFEKTVGFPLTDDLLAVYLASNGLSVLHLHFSPLHLVACEFFASEAHTNFWRLSKSVPIRNAVAGGRWGECWDCWLTNPQHNDAILQTEFFFCPKTVAQLSASYSYRLADNLTAVERALEAGALDCETVHSYWKVKLDQYLPDVAIHNLAEGLGQDEKEIKQLLCNLSSAGDYIACRFRR